MQRSIASLNGVIKQQNKTVIHLQDDISKLREENVTLKAELETKLSHIDGPSEHSTTEQNDNMILQQIQNDISHLREENDMLKSELKSKTQEQRKNLPKRTANEDDTVPKDTLIIGDSIIKNISETGLQNTKVVCIPGARIKDVKTTLNKLNVEDYTTIITHVGTNDCATEDEHLNVDSAYKEFEDLIQAMKSKAPNTKLILSTICPTEPYIGRVLTFNTKVLKSHVVHKWPCFCVIISPIDTCKVCRLFL